MKEIRFIILLTAVLFAVAFIATLPGNKVEGGADESSALPQSATVSDTSASETFSVATDSAGALVVGGNSSEDNMTIDNEWALYVINKDNPLPEDFVVHPKKVQGEYEMDYRAANYMLDMIEAAKEDGIDITVVSALRTTEYQQNLLDREIETFKSQGYSADEAYQKAIEGVAVPGQSEHNAGLAADLNQLDESFENTEAFRWLNENAHKYGFILRYPKGKQSITGIYYEPWHYRFVGVYHATKIKESGLTLEEYCKNTEG